MDRDHDTTGAHLHRAAAGGDARQLTDGEAYFGLFVLSPVDEKFQIKRAACIGVKNNGSQALTAVAATCDIKRAGQLFTITKLKAKDNGRPTYAISSGGAFLQYFPRTGLILEELGVDNGPAPKLG